MPELRWLSLARRELYGLASEIGRNSERAAFRFVGRIERKATLLVDHPRMGRRRDEVLRGSRSLVEGRHVIFYRTVPDTDEGPVDRVEILSVIDSRRDLRRVLARRPR